MGQMCCIIRGLCGDYELSDHKPRTMGDLRIRAYSCAPHCFLWSQNSQEGEAQFSNNPRHVLFVTFVIRSWFLVSIVDTARGSFYNTAVLLDNYIPSNIPQKGLQNFVGIGLGP